MFEAIWNKFINRVLFPNTHPAESGVKARNKDSVDGPMIGKFFFPPSKRPNAWLAPLTKLREARDKKHDHAQKLHNQKALDIEYGIDALTFDGVLCDPSNETDIFYVTKTLTVVWQKGAAAGAAKRHRPHYSGPSTGSPGRTSNV